MVPRPVFVFGSAHFGPAEGYAMNRFEAELAKSSGRMGDGRPKSWRFRLP